MTDSSKRPSPLFVWTHNTGRSALGAALARHQAGERAEVASAGIAPACDPEDSGDASPRPGTRRGRLGSGRHTSLASTTRCVPGSR